MNRESKTKHNNPKIIAFTDLEAWKKCHEFVLEIYTVSKKFPKEEIFSLTSQIRRAAISTTSNIAEGFGRQSYKERVYFYSIALGSLNETLSQAILAKDLLYTNRESHTKIVEKAETARKLLQGLLTKSKTFLH